MCDVGLYLCVWPTLNFSSLTWLFLISYKYIYSFHKMKLVYFFRNFFLFIFQFTTFFFREILFLFFAKKYLTHMCEERRNPKWMVCYHTGIGISVCRCGKWIIIKNTYAQTFAKILRKKKMHISDKNRWCVLSCLLLWN